MFITIGNILIKGLILSSLFGNQAYTTDNRNYHNHHDSHDSHDSHGSHKSHDSHSHTWGYGEDNGPRQWGKMGFEMCEMGKSQSPINIITRDTKSVKNSVSFNYKTDSKNIVNNGHTLQVNFDKQGYITFKNKRYKLVQFHFHTPSENHIDSKSYPLEMHLVHASDDNKLAVVAILFNEGRANGILQDIVNTAPKDIDDSHELNDINVAAFLPKSSAYYTFSGSLTTPPCSESVQFIVLKGVVDASKDQIDSLHEIMHNNNRNIQSLNGRLVESAR